MREILFRGKAMDDERWLYGWVEKYSFGRYPLKMSIIPCDDAEDGYYHHVMVDPETVGQFTGLIDKKGKKIFEGDIIDCWSEGVNAKGTVQQRRDGMWIIYPAWQKMVQWGLCPDEYCHTTVEVIGNIHDNPELLEI